MDTFWARAAWGARRFCRPVLIGWAVLLATGLGGACSVVAGDDSSASGRKEALSRPVLIDKYIEEAWKKAGVKPAKIASDEEFLRRAYLDLVGRIPTVQEARAFLSTRENDKRGKLITYLLDHADYAKNFATLWSVLLIGRGNQGQMVDRPALTGWLRKQFANDRPWNDVVRDLVASTGSNKENGAVNYVLAQPRVRRCSADVAHHQAVPGSTDPVHPVPRPPVQRVEADRFLGDQRLFQGNEDRSRAQA